MHMADAFLSPPVAGTMYACSGATLAHSVRVLKREDNESRIPVMGVMGAFVFAAQMINFTIPGTGSSGHLAGGMLLAAIVGPEAAFLTMCAVLSIQCLLFADGGLLALGANIWNMAFYGCFLGGKLWQLVMKGGISKKRIVSASLLGAVLSMQLGAFSVSLETAISGVTPLPFTAFLLLMQPIHLAIGLGEGLITAAVLLFVFEARPSLLQNSLPSAARAEKLSAGRFFGLALLASLLTAGGLSLFASAFPDGLEWSVLRLTGSTEPESVETPLHRLAAAVQDFTARFPDYSLGEGVVGSSAAGILGALAVLLTVARFANQLRRRVYRK